MVRLAVLSAAILCVARLAAYGGAAAWHGQAANPILSDTPPDRGTTRPASQPASQPYKSFLDITLDLGGGVAMECVFIPNAKKFMMGSPKEEKDRNDNEGPQREVKISRPFYMGKYEVTQEQYEKIMGRNPSRFKGKTNPVEQVSWNDAVVFCQKLSKHTGRGVHLPTEAQWEWACRAGEWGRFSFGEDPNYAEIGGYAWYKMNSGEKTHPVGLKKPNGFGLYDMYGNVLEWCADWYADSYPDKAQMDPTGPEEGSHRVLRGGGWYSVPGFCRSAFRHRNTPGDRSGNYGLRIVVDFKF